MTNVDAEFQSKADAKQWNDFNTSSLVYSYFYVPKKLVLQLISSMHYKTEIKNCNILQFYSIAVPKLAKNTKTVHESC